MVTVRQGGRVYGPGVFMFEHEAAQVKLALLAYGTKVARRLADEIGMPSDGVAYPHGGEIASDCETVEDVLSSMDSVCYDCSYERVRSFARRIKNALKIERALRTTAREG